MKLNPRFAGVVAAAALSLVGSAAQATLLTSNAGYTGPGLNLTAYANGLYNFTFGPQPIPGGITFTSNVVNSNSGQGSVLGQGGYGLGANGNFGGSAVYAGLDGPSGFMSFTFANPVASFGAFMNYAAGFGFADQLIGAYDVNGNLLEEWDLVTDAPISTPGGFNAFEFRGISLASAVIKEFRMSNGYILAAATANGDPVETPEPTTLALLGASVLGLRLRRRAKQA